MEVNLTFKIRVKSSCKAPDESKGIVSTLTVCMDKAEMIPLSRWKCRTQALSFVAFQDLRILFMAFTKT